MTRSKKQQSPTSTAIRDARIAASLTQTEAAQAVRASLRGWQQWEAGDRAMPPGLFELFMLKTGQWPLDDETNKELTVLPCPPAGKKEGLRNMAKNVQDLPKKAGRKKS